MHPPPHMCVDFTLPARPDLIEHKTLTLYYMAGDNDFTTLTPGVKFRQVRAGFISNSTSAILQLENLSEFQISDHFAKMKKRTSLYSA